MKKNHLWWRFSVFFDEEELLFIYHQVSLLLYNKIRYMLICKNNGKFAYNLLPADGVYVNN